MDRSSATSPDMLWMADDVFTIHHGWILEYAAEMKRRGIRIPFECITRADRLNAAMAETLAELGCMRVWIGSESGSQRILDAMQRGVTVEQVRDGGRAVPSRMASRPACSSCGAMKAKRSPTSKPPWSTSRQCRPDVFFTTVSYPIKGTPYFEQGQSATGEHRPWAEQHRSRYSVFAAGIRERFIATRTNYCAARWPPSPTRRRFLRRVRLCS